MVAIHRPIGSPVYAEGVVMEESEDGNLHIAVSCGRFEAKDLGRSREVTVEGAGPIVP